MPCCDETTTTRPRASPRGSCSSICAIARLQPRKTPRRLTAMIASQSCSDVSSSPFECRPAMPALQPITSSRPHRSTAVDTSRSTSSQREASASRKRPRSPSSASVGSPPSTGSRRTSPTTTRAPSSAKRSAIARPRPEAPPVTTAVRPSSRADTTQRSLLCETRPPVRIAELRTFVVGTPPPHVGGRSFVFLELVGDDGLTGVGEVYSATFGPRTTVRMIEDVFARHVEGADPFRIELLWRNVYGRGYSGRPDISLVGVLSGIELACWDLVGKALERPVYDLLGGRVHERLRTYTYLYAEPDDPGDVYADPELAAERAAAYAARGFTALKFDPTGPYSTLDPRQPGLDALARCEAYVRAVREAV